MKSPAVTVATVVVLAFAFLQTSPVQAQGTDIGAASRPFPLNDESSRGSGNQGQSTGEQSKGAERSGDMSPEKSQARSGNAGETSFSGHRMAAHKRGRRVFALNHSRHRILIHRRGHHVVLLNEPSGAC
jgi:hypothetical protein